MSYNITSEEFYERMSKSLQRYFGVKPTEASKENLYKAICFTVRDILTETRAGNQSQFFVDTAHSAG